MCAAVGIVRQYPKTASTAYTELLRKQNYQFLHKRLQHQDKDAQASLWYYDT